MRVKLNAAVGIVIIILLSPFIHSQNSRNLAYNFTKIADGVYLATGNGRMLVGSLGNAHMELMSRSNYMKRSLKP